MEDHGTKLGHIPDSIARGPASFQICIIHNPKPCTFSDIEKFPEHFVKLILWYSRAAIVRLTGDRLPQTETASASSPLRDCPSKGQQADSPCCCVTERLLRPRPLPPARDSNLVAAEIVCAVLEGVFGVTPV